MIFKKYYFSIVCLCFTFQILSQDDYVNDNQMRYEDWTYKSYIKTVQLHESSFDANPAILRLNGTELLELSFDDLEADKKNYSVSFVHCNANWEASNLMNSEFMDGFYEANFLNFDFSTNTIQKFTHYSILFPQSNLRFTKSGNYIAYVYQDNDKEKIIITKRFMIYEDKVTVVANVRQAIGNDEQYEKQHIDFNVINSQYELTNPYTDMKVIITQNNRWDNAVNNIKPTFTEPRQLTYSLDDKSTFNG
ncbi:MAG: type IX secretion system plug protein domain-containing protein, partial [Bacteroidota bacterium]